MPKGGQARIAHLLFLYRRSPTLDHLYGELPKCLLLIAKGANMRATILAYVIAGGLGLLGFAEILRLLLDWRRKSPPRMFVE